MDLAKEKERERWYSYLLVYHNIDNALYNPKSVHKISANCKKVFSKLEGDKVTFEYVKPLANSLFEECSNRPWFKKLELEERETLWKDGISYIAYHIWDFKRVNNNIVSETYWEAAAKRHLDKMLRKYGHEAMGKMLKDNKELLEGIGDSSFIPELIQAFSDYFKQLCSEEDKLYGLLSYDHLRTRPLIEPGQEFPE